jgi:hypothetical protein
VHSWLAGLRKCLREAEGQGQMVLTVALDMREQDLAIPEPYSLVKMVKDTAAKQRVQPPQMAKVTWIN